MKMETKQQELDDKREFLLLKIVKLKHKNRNEFLKLKKQNDYLNRIANEIVVSSEENLDMFAFKLNQMFKDEKGGKD